LNIGDVRLLQESSEQLIEPKINEVSRTHPRYFELAKRVDVDTG